MTALKTIIPSLATVLGESEATLYERQKLLTREGLLKARPGHGRGSGVEATPQALATLLIGMVVSEGLSSAAARAKRICAARKLDGECPLTGQKSFRDALGRILGDAGTLQRVSEVLVGITLSQVLIRYDEGDPEGPPPSLPPFQSSLFVGSRAASDPIHLTASIPLATLKAVAKVIGP